MRTLLIEHTQLSFDDCLTLSGDPEAEGELPDKLHIIVNHEAEPRFVDSIRSFIDIFTGIHAQVFVASDHQWFGFILSEGTDLDAIKDRFDAAFRGGMYRITEISWGSDRHGMDDLSHFLEENPTDPDSVSSPA